MRIRNTRAKNRFGNPRTRTRVALAALSAAFTLSTAMSGTAGAEVAATLVDPAAGETSVEPQGWIVDLGDQLLSGVVRDAAGPAVELPPASELPRVTNVTMDPRVETAPTLQTELRTETFVTEEGHELSYTFSWSTNSDEELEYLGFRRMEDRYLLEALQAMMPEFHTHPEFGLVPLDANGMRDEVFFEMLSARTAQRRHYYTAPEDRIGALGTGAINYQDEAGWWRLVKPQLQWDVEREAFVSERQLMRVEIPLDASQRGVVIGAPNGEGAPAERFVDPSLMWLDADRRVLATDDRRAVDAVEAGPDSVERRYAAIPATERIELVGDLGVRNWTIFDREILEQMPSDAEELWLSETVRVPEAWSPHGLDGAIELPASIDSDWRLGTESEGLMFHSLVVEDGIGAYGVEMADIRYHVEQTGAGEYRVSVVLPAEFLRSSDRAWPVRVDPNTNRYHGLWDNQQGYSYQQRRRTCNWWGWSCSTSYPTGGPHWSNWPHSRGRDFTRYIGFWRWYLPSLFGDWPRVRWINYVDYRSYMHDNYNTSWDTSTYIQNYDVYDLWPDYHDGNGGCLYRGSTYWRLRQWTTHRLGGCVNGHVWDRRNNHFVVSVKHVDGRSGASNDLQRWYYDAILYVHFTAWYPDTPYNVWTDDRSTSSAAWGWANGWNPGTNYLEVSGRGTYNTGWGSTSYTVGGFPENYCYAGRIYSCNYWGCSGRTGWATACSRIGTGSEGYVGDYAVRDINYISGERQTMRIDQRNSPRGNAWAAGYSVAVNRYYPGRYDGWRGYQWRQDYDNYRVEWAGWNVEPPYAYYIALRERNQNNHHYSDWRYEWFYPIPDTPWYMNASPASTSQITWSWPNVNYEWGYTVMTSGGSGLVNTGSSAWTEGSLAENSCYSRKVRSYRGNDGNHSYARAHSYDSPTTTGCTRVRDPSSGSFSLSVLDSNRVRVNITNRPANYTAGSTAVQYQWRACSTCGWQTAANWTSTWTIDHTNNQSGAQVFYRVRFRNQNNTYTTPWSGERSVLMPLDKDAWEDGDDTSSTNNVISSPTTQANHNIDVASDVDWYRIPIASSPSLVGITVLNNTDSMYVELCDGSPAACDGPGGASPTAASAGYGTRSIQNIRATGSNVYVRVQKNSSAPFVQRYDFRLDYVMPRRIVQNFENRPGSAFTGYEESNQGYTFHYGNSGTASSGNYGWLLASWTSSWRNNNLHVRLGLQGVSRLGVYYHSHERGAEYHHYSGNHTGEHANGDGLYVSTDNWNWSHLARSPANTGWVAGSGNVSGSTAFLKFTQYENDAWSSGGRVIDDIEIYADGGVTFGTPGLWTGGCIASGSNTNWFAGCNWDDGNVPGTSTDVRIPSGVPAYPHLASNHDICVGGTASGCDAYARSLTVDASAQLRSDAQNWYWGTVTINGAIYNRAGSSNSTRIYGGTTTISSTGRLETTSGSGSYHDLRVEGGGTLTNNGGTLLVGDQLWVYGTLNLNGGQTYVNYGGVGSTTHKLYIATGASGGFSNGAHVYTAPRQSSTQYALLIDESGFSVGDDTTIEIHAGGYGNGAAWAYIRSDTPIGNLVINRAGYPYVVQGTLNIDGDVTLAAGMLHGDNELIQVRGNWTNSGGFFEGATSRVRLIGNGNQSIGAGEGSNVDFNIFEVNKAGGTVTLTQPLDTHHLELRSGTLNANQRVRVAGNLTHLSGFTYNPSNWIYFDGGNQTLTVANLGVREVSFGGSGTKTISGRLFQTQSAATQVAAGATLRVPSGSTYNDGGSQTVDIDGHIRVEGGTATFGSASASGSWAGGSTLTVTGGLFQAGELNLSNATTTLTGGEIRATDDLIVGNIAMTAGTLQNGGGGCYTGRFLFAGSTSISGGSLLVNQGAGRGLDVNPSITWSGAPASTIIRGTSIEGAYGCGSGHGAAYTMDFDSAGVNLGALTIQSSTIFGDAASGIVASSVTINGGRILDNNRGVPISISGNWTNNGSYLPGAGTVTFVGGGNSTVVAGGTFHNLTVNKSSTGVSLGISSQTATTTGSTTISSGTLGLSGATLVVANNFTNNDAYSSAGGSRLIFNGSASSQLQNGSCGSCTLEHMRLDKSSAAAALSIVEASLAMSGNLEIYGGYIDDAVALNVGGSTTIEGVSASARLTVAGGGASLSTSSLLVRHGAASGSYVHQGGTTTVSGDLTTGIGTSTTSAGGSTLAVSGGVIDVNGTCRLHGGATGSASSTYAHSAGTIRCDDGVSIAGSGSIAAQSNQYGTVVVDGGGATLTCDHAGFWLPSLQIAATGATAAGSSTCSIYGSLAVNASAGLTLNANTQIRGDLSVSGSFAHGTSSTLSFVGDATSAISGVTSLGTLAVDKATTSYTVTAPASLAVDSLTVTRGDFRVPAGGTLLLGTTASHLVGASGQLSLFGTAANRTALRRVGNSGDWTLDVDGTIAANNTTFEYMDTGGLDVNGNLAAALSGADIFAGTIFQQGASSGVYLDLTNATGGGSATFELRDVTFATGSVANNVAKLNDAGRVTMRDGGGALWGAQFENDPNDRVDWAECPIGFSTLPTLANDTPINGTFTTQTTDSFKINLEAGKTYVIAASARNGSTVRPTLRIATPAGACLIRSGTTYVTESHELAVLFTATQNGEHFVTIGKTGGTGDYTLGYKYWPTDSELANCSVSYKGAMPFGGTPAAVEIGVTDLAAPGRFGIRAFRDGQQAQTYATPELVARETYQLTIDTSGSSVQLDVYGSSRDSCSETYFIGTTRDGFNVFNFQPIASGIQVLHFVQRTNIGAATDFGGFTLGVDDERPDEDSPIAVTIDGLDLNEDGNFTAGPSGWVNHDVVVRISAEDAACDDRPELTVLGDAPGTGFLTTDAGYVGTYREEGRHEATLRFSSGCDSSISKDVRLAFGIDRTDPVITDGWAPVIVPDVLFDGESWSYVGLTALDTIATDAVMVDPGVEASGLAEIAWSVERDEETIELLRRDLTNLTVDELAQGASLLELDSGCDGAFCREDGSIDVATLSLGEGTLLVTLRDRAGNASEGGRFAVERTDVARSLDRLAAAVATWTSEELVDGLTTDVAKASAAWSERDLSDLIAQLEAIDDEQRVAPELERYLDEVTLGLLDELLGEEARSVVDGAEKSDTDSSTWREDAYIELRDAYGL